MASAEAARRPLAGALEVSEYLGVPVPTLYQWRARGIGPKSARVGRHLRYAWPDVDAYLASLTSDQTIGSAA